ncbi:MAG: bi-domain-containing oxidoreductase [Ignavibacteriaceae bacterium]
MKQLTQTLKDGTMTVMEVPLPALNENSILVKNHYSVISAGTEGKTVKDARLGYIGKAKARQKEVKMVLETAKTQGIKKTYEMVMNKLDALSSLGYSCAGEVIEIGKNITEFKVGDYAACGGANAVHAEVVSIPINLSVKVDKSVDMKYAAFTTVASIAMQGIRQADLRLGETCVIIGLGLIGQLTIQLLNAAGVNVIGIDIDERQVSLANELGAKLSINRNADGLEQIIKNETNGFGCDSVIITAGTSSNDPVELAGRLCRQKGKVIIVGAVPTGFSREAYYKKELELKMSCSYGPGRYDTDYEENGIDYPIGYVRWTENRNMQAFVELLKKNKINMEKLITHIYKLDEAPAAYNMILGKTEPFIGILLKYDLDNKLEKKISIRRGGSNHESEINIGFIGAGSFAQNMILPNIPKYSKLISVATSRGNTSKNIAQKYGFTNAVTSADEIIKDKNINTIFITTRHNLHSENVIKSLEAGMNVFVEKPLCMSEDELYKIKEIYGSSNGRLMLGFNRRFAPQIEAIKKRTIDNIPKSIIYRINAGYIPKEHWTQDIQVGGGRIIGEVCHFIDLAMFVAGSKIKTVYATALENNENLNDILSVQLQFANGSIANISYFANGSKKLSKEYLEIFYAGTVYIINDFKEMEIYSDKKEKVKLSSQDKGHKNEVELFLNSIKEGKPSPISFDDIFISTLAAFKVIESISTGNVIKI